MVLVIREGRGASLHVVFFSSTLAVILAIAELCIVFKPKL